MIGIYKITNLLTSEVYIGQSTNIEQRVKEHKYHAESYIDQIISEIGLEYFSFEVLELCEIDQLDKLEEYYIDYYHSNYPGYGYNLVKGGQHNKGESNANVILTEREVYNIREAYKNHEKKNEVYELYKHKISSSYFSQVWDGTSWKHVHYDVYTKENLDYYKYQTSIGENSSNASFTNDEVLNLRKRYINESAKEIYESVKDRCSYSTLQCILWGRHYSNIPVYDKKNKKWINK